MNTARNARCPCGSGKRYKECCGRLPAGAHGATAQVSDAAARMNLANALARAGRYDEALEAYQGALALEEDFAQAHANLAELYLDRQEPLQARTSAARALTLNPNLAQAHHTLGKALMQLRCPDAAADSLRRALLLQPRLLDACINLGLTLRGLGNLAEAARAFDQAIDIDPRCLDGLIERATVSRLQGRQAECEALCDRALALAEECPRALAVLAELRADLGQFAQAQKLHRQILARDAAQVESFAALARLKRMTAADGDWLAEALHRCAAGLTPHQERVLRYAMGKFCDDVAEYDAAFDHYRRANALTRACAPGHDRMRLENSVESLITDIDAGWLAAHRRAAAEGPRPVLIVGMLRSGTSLTEQILASHPAVFGAGELPFWSERLAGGLSTAQGAGRRDWSRRLPVLSRDYRTHLREIAGGHSHVVDKQPTNFLFLGVVHAALSEARIIHMRRDPRDTALSIYFQDLEAANAYATDLHDIAHYYRQYQRLMRHWRELLPGEVFMEVDYEDLVRNTEGVSRRMLDFLGLPWDERCLGFERTQRAILTASRWQVRQGMQHSSVGRWRHYERHLGPLSALAAQDSGI